MSSVRARTLRGLLATVGIGGVLAGLAIAPVASAAEPARPLDAVEAGRAVPPAEPKPEVDGVSELDVLTFNVWHGGTQVDDGAREIADIIQRDRRRRDVPARGR